MAWALFRQRARLLRGLRRLFQSFGADQKFVGFELTLQGAVDDGESRHHELAHDLDAFADREVAGCIAPGGRIIGRQKVCLRLDLSR